MIHPYEVSLRIVQDRMRDLQREATIQRQRPSYRQRLAAALVRLAKWLEPELVEGAPALRLLSR